ncbi:MAG: Ig-like domain-containing protein [Lachnospiraceae bacterium]|nr:Ig-like domain-containing protein [Lachnospiraceae bacterium]
MKDVKSLVNSGAPNGGSGSNAPRRCSRGTNAVKRSLAFVVAFFVALTTVFAGVPAGVVKADEELEVPAAIGWGSGSERALATWAKSNGANAYELEVFAYTDSACGDQVGNSEIVGCGDDDSLDLQNAIHLIAVRSGNNSLTQVYVKYKIRAINTENSYNSSFSDLSEAKLYSLAQSIQLSKPQMPLVTEEDGKLYMYFNVDDEVYHGEYRAYVYPRDINDESAWNTNGYDFFHFSGDSVKNDYVYTEKEGYNRRIELGWRLKLAYLDYNYDYRVYDDGEQEFKIAMIKVEEQSAYFHTSEYSEPAYGTFVFNSYKEQFAVPTNIALSDDLIATWDAVPNADVIDYMIRIKIDNEEPFDVRFGSFNCPNENWNGSISDGVYSIDLKPHIKNRADQYLTKDTSYAVSYSVMTCGFENQTRALYQDSDYSVESPTKNWVCNIDKYATPQNVSIDDEYVVSWESSIALEDLPYEDDMYQIKVRFLNEENEVIWDVGGTVGLTSNALCNFGNPNFDGEGKIIPNLAYYDPETGRYMYDITDHLSGLYARGRENENESRIIHSGDIVKVAVCVYLTPNYYSGYFGSDVSEYSAPVLYSDKVLDFSITPSNPIVYKENSINVGVNNLKPRNAYHSGEAWSVNNDSIATINANGRLTGKAAGEVEVTAQIGNVGKTVTAHVYDVNTNVTDEEDQDTVKDTAGDIIDSLGNEGVYNEAVIDLDSDDTDALQQSIIDALSGGEGEVGVNLDAEELTSDAFELYYESEYEPYKGQYASFWEWWLVWYCGFPRGYHFAYAKDYYLQLFCKKGSNSPTNIGKIKKFDKEITITSQAHDMPAVADGYVRQYKLIRLHQGETPRVMDDSKWSLTEGNGFTAETDSFSDYLMTYTDVDADSLVTFNRGEEHNVTSGSAEYGDDDFTITASAKNIDEATWSWESSNTSVATVANNAETATITVGTPGTTVITATYSDGNETLSGVYYLTVEPRTVGLSWSDLSQDYTGFSIYPSCEATGLVNGDTCEVEVSVDGEHINAGDYVATAAALSNPYYYRLPSNASTDFCIAKVNLDLSLSMEGWTYGEEPNEPELTGNLGNGVVQYTYSTDQSEYTTDIPTNANTYWIKASVSETKNYNSGTAETSFTINKATPEVEAPSFGEDLYYTGEDQELVVGGLTTGGSMKYSLDGTNWEDSVPVGNDAGDYTVYYKVDGGNNYEDVSSQSMLVCINAKELTINGLDIADKTYDGSDTVELPGNLTLSDGVIEGDDVALLSPTTGTFADKNVGTDKTVTVAEFTLSGADAGNYTITQPTGLTATIAPKDTTVSVTATGRKYEAGNTSVSLVVGTVTSAIVGDDVAVDISEATATIADANVGVDKPVTVTGVKLKGADAGNYNLTGLTSAVTVTIDKADNPLSGTASASVTTGGSLDLSTYKGSAVGDVTYGITQTLSGCLVDETTGDFSAGSTAGVCKVTISAAGNTYYAAGNKVVTITVSTPYVPPVVHTHTWPSTGTVTKEATCTETGIMTYQCTTCSTGSKTETIPAKGHTLTAHVAKEATCAEEGNKAYWECSICKKFFSDAQGKAETTEAVVKIAKTDKHTLTAHEAVAATCEKEGKKAYWECSVCKKLFSDTEAKTEVEEKNLVEEMKAHTLTAHEAVEETCTEDGKKAYWECSVCKKLFSDKDGKTETTETALVEKAKGHKLTAYEEVKPTCTEDGKKEYWECSECKKLFADAEGKTETTEAELVIKTEGHKLTHVEAVEATTEKDGNIEYWTCSVCGKYFADAEGKSEITKEQTVLPKSEHKLTLVPEKKATCTEDGNKAYYTCSHCDKLFEDAEGKKEISKEETIIKSEGHKLTHVEAKDPTVDEEGNLEYWTCSECGKFFKDAEGKEEIAEEETKVEKLINIAEAVVTGLGNKAWTGSAIKPTVTVKLDGKTLKKGTDYTVSYSNNTNAGNATVKITGKDKYGGTVKKTFAIKKVTLKYRAYVQKKNWMSWSTAGIGTKVNEAKFAGTTDNLRMETIQMQLTGIGGSVKYRAYVEKMGWTQWATTADKTTFAGTKGMSRRVEMIQLKAAGQVANLYDMYYRTYCEKFGWLGWAGNNEKSGSAGYARKLEAFQVQFVPKGTKFNQGTANAFYDMARDGMQ